MKKQIKTIYKYINIKSGLTQYQKAAQICLHNLKLFQKTKVAFVLDVMENSNDTNVKNFNSLLFFVRKYNLSIDIYGGLLDILNFRSKNYDHVVCTSSNPNFIGLMQLFANGVGELHCTTVGFTFTEYKLQSTICSSNVKIKAYTNEPYEYGCFNRINQTIVQPLNYNMYEQHKGYLLAYINGF